MRFVTKKRVAAAVAALAIGSGAMAAYAYFTGGSGTDTKSAHTGSTVSWTVALGAGGFTGGPMYPGSGTETDTYTVTNTGGGNQALQTVTASVKVSNGNITQNGVELANCTASWYTASVTGPTPATGTVIAKNGTATGSVNVVLTESNTSQNACIGATPDVQINVT